MTIRNQLLETFARKVQTLNKKKSKFSYRLSIFSLNPRINEHFFGEGITFQPTGMNNIDVPLLFNKTEKIFEETIEFLFDILIQEKVLQEDGSFQGIYHLENESSKEAKATIIFELHGLSEDSKEDKYIIELPKYNFDYNATKSIYNQYIDNTFPNHGYSYNPISSPRLEF
ncbi:hypothetical protein LCGC14_2013370 [marine sediment metagenome]|uniref:Uncharacterized protein n=1 Tax=marine sediment metagenome TaxID=412755 RepID=A0A0F9HWW6_9ZZZZ